PEMANTFANHGFVAFSINYRLWPGCSIDSFHIELSNAISDVVTALKWIKKNSQTYHIDTTRIMIAGDSAGGGLVVNTAYSNPLLFIGVIDLWGGLPPYGIQKNGSKSVNAFPVSQLTPPTCMIHGSADDVVPYSVSQRLSDSLTAAKVYNEIHPLTGAKHYPNHLSDQIFPLMVTFADKIVFGNKH
ncbi:MAG TPA: alpha/beta hydrolase, partial [Prolixibacteraceae bacterium]